jgi:asparagine synthase (glutamine-hydrolysing)
MRAEDIGPDALLELLGRLDEPFCDGALVPTYILSELTRQHVKVAISGDGGDEVFGGYPKYLREESDQRQFPLMPLMHQTLHALPWRPRGAAHVYERGLSSQEKMRFSMALYGDFPVFRKDMRQLLKRDYWQASEIESYFEPWERRAKPYGQRFNSDVLMRTDLETYLSENCLVKTDRASMLASLEVRVPFLDEIVLDRILPLHAGKKIVNGQL